MEKMMYMIHEQCGDEYQATSADERKRESGGDSTFEASCGRLSGGQRKRLSIAVEYHESQALFWMNQFRTGWCYVNH